MTCECTTTTGTLPVAMMFDPHSLEMPMPYAPPHLTTPQTRLALLEAPGTAFVMLMVSTLEFAAMSPETFVCQILLGMLNMRELLLGYDFTLGKDRIETSEVLAQLGKTESFNVSRIDALSVHDEVVSSTCIWELLHQGQTWGASSLLDRLYSVQGEVIHGKSRGGRLLGFPAANLAPTSIMLPKPGIYVMPVMPSESVGGGSPFVFDPTHPTPNTYPTMTNIGYNSTFGSDAFTAKTHLLDSDVDLYGKHLEVTFVECPRGEVTFTNPDSFIVRIKKDVDQIRKILGTATGE